MPKQRELKRIDVQPPFKFGVVTEATTSTDSPAPPVFQGVTPPTNVQLSTAVYESAVTPSAIIGVTWTEPGGYDPVTYRVQYSTDSTFATDYATIVAEQPSASIYPVPANTLYYVRVATVYRSQVSDWSAAASITTAQDTTPPADVSSQAATFIGVGDLVVTWTNPTSLNFKDVEINIYASNGGALLATINDATGRYVWTAAQNLAATAGAGDPSLYVTLQARSFGNVMSATALSASATKSAPSAPTISVDFTGRDAVYTITPPSDAAKLSLVADTGVTARTIAVAGRYAYSFDANRLDHSGTPDPVLSYSWTAIDGLNQSSTATTGTATNAAPSAPTVTITLGFSQILCTVTSTKAADFEAYEYKWTRDASTVVRTLESASSEQAYEASGSGDEGSHTWTCTVRQKDAFGQFSTATVSSSVTLDNLTIGYLRSGAFYSDSPDNNTFVPPASGTLSALKDGVTASGGVTYAA